MQGNVEVVVKKPPGLHPAGQEYTAQAGSNMFFKCGLLLALLFEYYAL